MTSPTRQIIVSVIGDANLPERDPRRDLAYETGRCLVDAGFAVMTGGMGGVMDAALHGGRSSPNWMHGRCIGVLPGSNPEAAHVSRHVDIAIPTGLDHGRNLVVAQADAVIAIGGGAGTLSEMAFAWCHRRLLIGLRCAGWSGRLADAPIDSRQRYPDIPDDRVHGADTGAEAAELVQSLYPRYSGRHTRIPG
ncbi:MAG: acyl-CoA synthetase [Rhodobacteraceae bacterium]|nr:MAG: acyl-CoA synthetase [Paracoccaceae bacterium]